MICFLLNIIRRAYAWPNKCSLQDWKVKNFFGSKKPPLSGLWMGIGTPLTFNIQLRAIDKSLLLKRVKTTIGLGFLPKKIYPRRSLIPSKISPIGITLELEMTWSNMSLNYYQRIKIATLKQTLLWKKFLKLYKACLIIVLQAQMYSMVSFASHIEKIKRDFTNSILSYLQDLIFNCLWQVPLLFQPPKWLAILNLRNLDQSAWAISQTRWFQNC